MIYVQIQRRFILQTIRIHEISTRLENLFTNWCCQGHVARTFDWKPIVLVMVDHIRDVLDWWMRM